MKKERQVEAAEKYLNDVIESTKLKNPKLGKVLSKWRYLILKTARRVAFFKEEDCQDSLGDLLIPLVQLNETYEDTHYRYKRKIYEVEYEDLGCILLNTPQYSKLKKDRFVTMRYKVEKVNKASLSSLAYHKIQQTGSRLLRDHFTQKNGYKVIATSKGVVKARKHEYQKTHKVVDKKVLSKAYEVRLDQYVDDDEGQNSFYDIIASSYDQETTADFSIILSDLYNRCSNTSAKSKYLSDFDPCLILLEAYELCSAPAKKVFKCLVQNSTLTDLQIRNKVRVFNRRLDFSKREIKMHIEKVLDKAYKPVYSPYLIYEGKYFFKGDETDLRIGLKDAEDNMVFVDKKYVEYDNETPYRTPVHLTAAMV